MTKKTNIRFDQAKNSVGATDWNRLKSLTDEEALRSAAADSNTKTFAPQELKQFKRMRLRTGL